MVNGENDAEVVAIVTLKDLRRSIVGMVPTKEDELWNAGLPMIFVVDGNGLQFFIPIRNWLWSERPWRPQDRRRMAGRRKKGPVGTGAIYR